MRIVAAPIFLSLSVAFSPLPVRSAETGPLPPGSAAGVKTAQAEGASPGFWITAGAGAIAGIAVIVALGNHGNSSASGTVAMNSGSTSGTGGNSSGGTPGATDGGDAGPRAGDQSGAGTSGSGSAGNQSSGATQSGVVVFNNTVSTFAVGTTTTATGTQ
jgi:hypothetical protein